MNVVKGHLFEIRNLFVSRVKRARFGKRSAAHDVPLVRTRIRKEILWVENYEIQVIFGE